jgi:metal-responsive CopG/Arc/MetJ family transcriptional regulator
MRTTKILAFSVSAEMEAEIQNQAKAERITLSEFIREAVRQYMEKKRI